MTKRLLFLCPLLIALALAASALLAQPAPPHLRIAQGELVGDVTEMGPYVFKGLPYAAPPVGPLRWREPQPPASWQGSRDAAKFAPTCMQPIYLTTPPSPMSEDCLYLNVWTSDLHPANPAPVLVYIHGGSYISGGGSRPSVDGTNLAVRGAVVVTINYRLGIFGFFAHPDLTAASPHHSSGNYALLDQLAALRWVRQNISSFGGDPHNVTVFGESAGAGSIGYLIVSPLSQGLFDKAILESPTMLFIATPELKREYDGLSSQESVGLAVAPHISDLQNLSAADVMARAGAATLKFFGPGGNGHPRMRAATILQDPSAVPLPWAPIVDGYVIPDQPAKLYAEGHYLHIPTMAGTNTDEGNLFLTHYHPDSTASFAAYVEHNFAPCAKQVLARYGPATAEQAHASANRLLTDAIFLHPTVLFARDTHGYLYRFTHVSPHGAETGLGAFHSSELDYVFGHTHRPDSSYQTIDHKISDQMMTIWLHFARTGDPNLMNSSDWTRIGSNGEISYMDFGDTFTVKPFPDATFSAFADRQFCVASQFASFR